MTGNVVGSFTTINARQASLDQFYAENFPAIVPIPALATPGADLPADDSDLLKIIRNSKQAAKFDTLWDGNTAGYGSASEAAAAKAATEQAESDFRQNVCDDFIAAGGDAKMFPVEWPSLRAEIVRARTLERFTRRQMMTDTAQTALDELYRGNPAPTS